MQRLLAITQALLIARVTASPPGPYGQLLNAYYSGVGADTLGAGGLNSISLAFFNPAPLASPACDFADPATPCCAPATGSGGSLNLAWALAQMNASLPALSANTSPVRGGRPTFLFSFGGATQGGAAWDALFGDAAASAAAGANAGWLVRNASAALGGRAFVGVDLDIEGAASALPHIGAFVGAFRAVAPAGTAPLQLCALSGCADPASADHFKLGLMRALGPAQGGIELLNLMVDNVEQSCAQMEAFWRAPGLQFLPPSALALGVWGSIYPSWTLPPPGCTDGAAPLFPWVAANGVNIAIWQWWTGDVGAIAAVLAQLRAPPPLPLQRRRPQLLAPPPPAALSAAPPPCLPLLPPNAPSPLWGAQYSAPADPAAANRTGALFAQLLAKGARLMQISLPWASVEPTPGSPNTALVAQVLSEVHAVGGIPLFNLAVIDTDRVSVPPDLADPADPGRLRAGLTWTSPELMDRYAAVVEVVLPVAGFYGAPYFGLANEADVLLAAHPDTGAAFAAFVFSFAAWIRTLSAPRPLSVGVTLTVPGLAALAPAPPPWLTTLLATCDTTPLTYYALKAGGSFRVEAEPAAVHGALLAAVGALPAGACAVLQEFGQPSGFMNASSVDGGSDKVQAAFFSDFARAVPALLEGAGHPLRAASAYELVDMAEADCEGFARYYNVSSPAFVEYLCTLGLVKGDGTAKEAFGAFLGAI